LASRLARAWGGTHVFDDLLEETAERLAGDGTELARDRVARKRSRGDRGDPAAALCRYLVLQVVALVPQPLDLGQQKAAFLARLLEDLLGRRLGALADRVGATECARDRVLDGLVVLFVDGDATVGAVELGLEE